jgi:hypothetical protein
VKLVTLPFTHEKGAAFALAAQRTAMAIIIGYVFIQASNQGWSGQFMLSGNTPSPPTNAQAYKQAEILQIVVSNALAPISMGGFMRVRTRTFKPSPKPRLPV